MTTLIVSLHFTDLANIVLWREASVPAELDWWESEATASADPKWDSESGPKIGF